ncbi:hypothetical protein D8B23_07040 [Verminephrobacter aporrectodeae subsp. tuberculatae]|uniref:thioester reductase domain-containing protein n=1 Tax=Verminephrobacter aporrectodeae TaxID=1110389 RepID=UPI002244DD2B|nr:non-ribosomal peptide synthetase [Verminephrobacter aporrectodeae]MCW8198182.1 hypothetical protein [Verminephrobacter aporrectodeae subsp. tuberculatae]
MNLEKHNVTDVFPATSLQQGMIYHALATNDPAMYLEQYGFSVEGELIIDRYRAAWQDTLDHHPTLRTCFRWEGLSKAYQVVYRQLQVPFEHIDLRATGATGQDTALDNLRKERRTCGFLLDRGPLFLVSVITLGERRHKVWLTLHHLLADGWSLTLLLAEVGRRYQNPALLVEPVVPFRRYCEWLQARDLQQARQWWQRRLCGGDFVGDAPLGVQHREGHASAVDLVLSREDCDRFQQGCKDQGVTESTVFNAAWAILLGRYLRQDRVIFGYTVSTRSAEIVGVERMLGLLLNVLPVPVELESQQGVSTWLRELHQQLVADRQHDYLPLSELQRLASGGSEKAMFETLLVWENQPGSVLERSDSNGLRIIHDESYERNHYPLMLAGFPGTEIRLRLTFSRGSLSDSNACALLQQVARLMVELVGAGERPLGKITNGLFARPLPSSQQPLPSAHQPGPWQRIVELSLSSPNAVQLAQVQPELTMTRSELVGRSQSLAGRLAALLPADRSAPIALILWPSVDYVCTILAALQLGRPWLAMDPRKPLNGLCEQLRHIKPAVLVSEPALWPDSDCWDGPVLLNPGVARLNAGPRTIPSVEIGDGDCVCMVLTSGSTGKPRCVRLPLRALRQRLAWMENTYASAPDDCMLLKTSPAFVDALCEVLAPLLSGYRLVALTPDQCLDLQQLHAMLSQHHATRLVITPSVLDSLLRVMPSPLEQLRILQVSGERFPAALLERARCYFPNARILNLYGSSEVMADACVFDCSGWRPGEESAVPLGRLLPGLEGAILDTNQRPLPPGAIGELYLGGDCLAIDYRGDRAGTDARFQVIETLGNGARMYATRDLVSQGEDGELRYHGRSDDQIKFNGVRIEPAEIEAILESCTGVDDAAVACHMNASGHAVLTAHIATRETGERVGKLISELKAKLRQQLASGQIPGHWQVVQDLPRNSSGKLNRRALCYQAPAGLNDELAHVPPRNADQETIAGLWKDVLGLDSVGIDEDFFAAGGNSISMTQLCFAIRKTFQVPSYPIRAAFEAPTIRQQSLLIQQYRRGAQPVLKTAFGVKAGHDLDQDAACADSIRPSPQKAEPWPEGSIRVFLSGAQGFINAWLLARLLDDPGVTVLCLAPSINMEDAGNWLIKHLRHFDLWRPAYAARLHPVAGDLGEKHFGLSPQDWTTLAGDCHVLFHTGVEINFVAPYERLRATNAMSTATILELATTVRTKPLHFIGSLGVIDHSLARSDSPSVREDDPLPSWQGLPNGYLQARWVSDTMIRRAIGRGIPCSAMRMTTVSGDSAKHQANPEDMMWQLFKLAMTVGIIPDSPRPIDLVPVDQAVDAVIALAKSSSSLGQVWHVSNPGIWNWREVAGLLRRKGYPTRILSGADWSQEFGRYTVELGQRTEWQKVLPLLGDSWLEYPHFFPLNKNKTLERLDQLNIRLPVMDESLLWRTVEQLVERGFLPAASETVTPIFQSEEI